MCAVVTCSRFAAWDAWQMRFTFSSEGEQDWFHELQEAVEKGDVDKVQTFIEIDGLHDWLGEDAPFQDLVLCAAQEGHANILEILLDYLDEYPDERRRAYPKKLLDAAKASENRATIQLVNYKLLIRGKKNR